LTSIDHDIEKEVNIYVGLTEMQRKWYRSVLEKDIDAVNGLTGKKEGKTRLMNMVMQVSSSLAVHDCVLNALRRILAS
jgi:hypothetical protein